MTSFLMWILILIVSPSNILREIDVVSLKERSHLIKFFLHAGMLRVESLSVVRTLDLFLALMSFVLVFLRVRRLILLVHFFRIWRIYFSILILLISFSFWIFWPWRKQRLIFWGFQDPHMCYGEKFLWLGVPQQTAWLQKSILSNMQ